MPVMWHDAPVTNASQADGATRARLPVSGAVPTRSGGRRRPRWSTRRRRSRRAGPAADLGPTPDTGLSAAEAAARAARGLGNDARIASGRTYPEILRDNVLQPVNILLGIICLVLAALGLYGDAAVTIVLVLVNIVVGLVQEVRAKRSLDRLSVLTRPTATVIRDGSELIIDPAGVVLGDLLMVRRGDQLLLDGKVSVGTFQADESLLTGESDRIPKVLGSEVLSGSFCVDGEARYVATRVGAGTFANQLTAGARAFRADRTPLQRDVAKVLRGMSLLVLIAAVPVLIRLYGQYGSLPAIETARAAAVLVALIPQGLVVMITVTYAMAIVRLAGQKALIQRSNAVESMSRVSVLCLDKTGTLTTPEIEVAEVHPLIDEAELARWLGSFVASTSLQNRSSDAIRGALSRWPEADGRGRGAVLVRAALERHPGDRGGPRRGLRAGCAGGARPEPRCCARGSRARWTGSSPRRPARDCGSCCSLVVVR